MDGDLTFKTALSLKGHDKGRRYVIAKVVSGDFVMVVDGKYRKLDNPKLKRIRHLRIDGDSRLSADGLTDAKLRKALKESD